MFREKIKAKKTEYELHDKLFEKKTVNNAPHRYPNSKILHTTIIKVERKPYTSLPTFYILK